jgi:hypothetical protein
MVWPIKSEPAQGCHVRDALVGSQRKGGIAIGAGKSGHPGSHVYQLRALIAERVRAGVAVARAQGKRIGGPRKDVNAGRVAELRAEGWSWAEVASEMGAGLGTGRGQKPTTPGP